MNYSSAPNLEPFTPSSPILLSIQCMLDVLNGVIVATKRTDDQATYVRDWIISQSPKQHRQHEVTRDWGVSTAPYSEIAYPFELWKDRIQTEFIQPRSNQLDHFHLSNLTLAVTFMRDKSRSYQEISTQELTTAWSMIHNALRYIPANDSPVFGHPARSAQGFIAVPLCSIIVDGLISELFRFHVWLPDGHRGNQALAVHSHQPWAQSWILSGKGTNYLYEAENDVSRHEATHATYALAWNNGQTTSTKYATHQKFSTVVNTKGYVKLNSFESDVHTVNMSYIVPSATFHRSDVAPDAFHSTLFYFDASRGFDKDAKVLGPVDGDSYSQERLVAGTDAARLAEMTNWNRVRDMSPNPGFHASCTTELGDTFRSATPVTAAVFASPQSP